MAKTHSQFVCQQCGYSQVGWAGKCPNCGSWGSLVETVIKEEKKVSRKQQTSGNKPVSLSSVPSRKTSRITTRISELDRVLGGGLVPGQVVLIAGEPGNRQVDPASTAYRQARRRPLCVGGGISQPGSHQGQEV